MEQDRGAFKVNRATNAGAVKKQGIFADQAPQTAKTAQSGSDAENLDTLSYLLKK
jgi:hypothetical protein